MKTLGIAAHSAEGGALCFLTACHEGERRMGAHMHPPIVVSALPMGLSMEGWESDDHEAVIPHLQAGVQQVADAGADFYICPDNTAHIVLEKFADRLALPGLHIADVVCREIERNGWKSAGLLGTKWTMEGSVYAERLAARGLGRVIPDAPMRGRINTAIFEELCQGTFRDETRALFHQAISDLKAQGADCVILGCTEIPLIVSAEESALPTLDSTRLLARYAVEEALSDRPIEQATGWLRIG